ncbi:MAG: hypothetical protein K940chlam9_01247 [Chlamydiae bacterium]|nr:hypothetical protein [Chlamydiota bacterium]
MTIYSQHTFHLQQTNDGYSLQGERLSSKEKVQSYLSSLPFDLIKIVEEQKTTYHYHSVSYSSKQNLRKALSRESRGAWIELSQGKARYFVDKGWIFSSPQKVSKQEYLQKLEAKAGKTTGIALGLLAMAPGLSELSRHISSREAALSLTLHKHPILSITAYSLMHSHAQAVGTEFQVNSYTTSDQQNPSITALLDGGFVIVWESFGQDGDLEGIYGQRYDSTGVKSGVEFQINNYTTDDQKYPSIASLNDGGFVITWQNGNGETSAFDIFGQRYAQNGTLVGDEFQVNSYTTSDQQNPSITALSDGGFAIVWDSPDQDGSLDGVYGQRYDSSGVQVGGEFQVNTYISSQQDDPSITGLSDGGFVVVWESFGQDGDADGIFGQLYGQNRTLVGDEFQVNFRIVDDQKDPSVASLNDGGFVVVWDSDAPLTPGIFGQRYGQNGTVVGNEFQVNTFTRYYYGDPSITGLSDGGFVVVWESDDQDEDNLGIFGKRYDANGNPIEMLNSAHTSMSSLESGNSIKQKDFPWLWVTIGVIGGITCLTGGTCPSGEGA